MMERNGVVDTNFKGFMATSAQANWNASGFHASPANLDSVPVPADADMYPGKR